MLAGRTFSVDTRALLEALTEQFPEPLLCVRELVQNAADAGAQRIAIEVAYDGERGLLRLAVDDDGRGMSAREIEGYLTIGHSEKDPARDRGRFGIGKLSPYALGIDRMVVETSDGENAYRIEFDGQGAGRLVAAEREGPGTRVRVYKACARDEAERWAHRTFEIVEETCGALPLRIEVNGVPVSGDPALLDGPYAHGFESGEVRGRLAVRSDPVQRLSSGQILLESGAPILGDGVSYTLDASVLSPTLSRNAVRRDAAYDAVVRLARAQIPALEQRVVAALTRRVGGLRRRGVAVERHLDPDDRAAVEWLRARLFEAEAGPVGGLADAPVFETADGDLVSLAALRKVGEAEGSLPTSRTPRSREEVSAYVDRGVPVLLLYRDVEDFLDAEGLGLIEVESRDEGVEIATEHYTRGERALLDDAPPPGRRANHAARTAGTLLAAIVVGAAAGSLAGRWVDATRNEAGAPPLSTEDAPVAIEAPLTSPWGGPLAGAGSLALLTAGGLAAWSRRRSARAVPIRRAPSWRWRAWLRAIRHPYDYFVARSWVRSTRAGAEARAPVLEGYRELLPEPETPVGVRLDLDRLHKGMVDLRGLDGAPSDARVLVVRDQRALLNRNHPTVERLIRLAERDVLRAHILLDALLASDPELARFVDPRQAEWDLIGRARARLARSRKRAP